MPQSFTLYPDLTVRENVDFVASLFGMLFRGATDQARPSSWSTCGTSGAVGPGGCRAGCSAGWSSPAPSSTTRRCSSSTSRRPGSTRSCAARVWTELHRLRDAGRTLIVTTQYVNEAESCDRVALISDGRLLALATPDELRREAVGGDIVVVETEAIFDGAAARRPAAGQARPPGRSASLTVVVDDAGTALPDVVEAVRARGGEVTSGREERPSFDDVFAALVERDRAARPQTEAEAEAAAAERPTRTTGDAEAAETPTDARVPRRRGTPPEDAVEAEWREADEPVAAEPDQGQPSTPPTSTMSRRRRRPRGSPMRALATTLLRLLALVGKELIEVIRRPGALVSLVLGPFLIMAIFGLGFNGERQPARDRRGHPSGFGPADGRRDLPGPRRWRAAHPGGDQRRRGGRGRAWPMAAPTWSSSPRPTRKRSSGPASSRSSGSWSTRSTRSARTTPASSPRTWPTPSTRRSSAEPSRRPRATSLPSDPSAPVIPPEVVAAPTKAEIQNTAPSEPQVLAYFGPAVLALILQHLAVTLVALALVRERTSGVIELFRVAPVNAWEVIAGKVLAYLLIGGLIAAADASPSWSGCSRSRCSAIRSPWPAHRARAAGLARDRPGHRGHLRLGAPGGPAVAAAAPRVGLLQRLRARHLRVHRAGPGAGLHAPGHPRDPADAGHHAARWDDPDLGVRGPRGRSPWSPSRGAGSACDEG